MSSECTISLPAPNGARDKVHPEFRQGQCFFCPCRKEGAKQSGVATAGSDVSFIEQIGSSHRNALLQSSDGSLQHSLQRASSAA